jgi:hypothetical protein
MSFCAAAMPVVSDQEIPAVASIFDQVLLQLVHQDLFV